MTTDTGKRILFRGRIDDLLRLLYPPAHIDDIASEIGCKAEVVPPYADPTELDVAQMAAEHYGELPEPKNAVGAIFGSSRLTGPGAKRPRVVGKK